MEHTRLKDAAELITGDAVAAVQRLSVGTAAAYDIIFLDPPYGLGLEDRVLEALIRSPLINAGSLIIIEMKAEADIAHFEEIGYKIIRSKEYKTNKHIFLGKA